MGMRVNSCCGCINLRTGVLILGYFVIISAVIQLGANFAKHDDQYYKYGKSIRSLLYVNELSLNDLKNFSH